MATIKDVAKLAGVSISTASYALNDVPNVHPATKKRILEAAAALQYSPHFSARNLKTKKTHNVGVFIYGFSGPVFSDVLEGIRQLLQENHYHIIVSSGKASESFLKEKQVDGAIIFDNDLSNDMISQVASEGLPIILLDREYTGDNIYHHTIQNETLVYEFMKTIVQKKQYQRYGFLAGPPDSYNAVHRLRGFEKALEEFGIADYTFYQGDFTVEGGHRIGLDYHQASHRPDFVFCANDESAIGFMQSLKSLRYKIPQDIALAGFDNYYMTNYLEPRITTIGIDHLAWGRQIAHAMIELLKGSPHELEQSPKALTYWRESC
jgi:LacI family transcriptional regulator